MKTLTVKIEVEVDVTDALYDHLKAGNYPVSDYYIEQLDVSFGYKVDGEKYHLGYTEAEDVIEVAF